jgi:hypothetical protein
VTIPPPIPPRAGLLADATRTTLGQFRGKMTPTGVG